MSVAIAVAAAARSDRIRVPCGLQARAELTTGELA